VTSSIDACGERALLVVDLPLTGKDAAALRRTLAIDDSVLADMRAAAAVLQPLVPTLVDEFYEWIEPTSELGARFAVDPTLVERVRREQTEYWQQFLAARRDESYVSQRRAVARLHARRELGLPIYLRALAFARRWLLRRLETEEALWRERPSLAESIRKLIHFEVVVIVNGYVERTAELLEEERGRVQRVVAVMRAFAHGELAREIEASTDARVGGWLDGLLECLEVSAGVPDGAMVEGSGAPEGDELGELLRAITQMVRREEAGNVRLQRLLTMSRAQAEELTTRQRQLAAANEQLEQLTRALESQKDALLGTESELRRKASELEKTSHRKSEFIANMSHELRSPLNATMVLARVLAENPEENLSPRQVEYARSIYSAGADLLALIDDILDLSKIEAGIVDLNVEPVPIEELLHELERRFRPLAEDSGLELAVALEQGLPPAIETDRQRLQQLLTNLLANALKYAEEGSVRIVASPRGSSHVAFAVEDTGPGIDPVHHESIFTPFPPGQRQE
jgi:signal transduction histidine kinase